MKFTLRPATVTDVDSLFDVRCSVRENHQSREELAELDITSVTVAEMIEGGDYVTLIAESQGEAVGFTMAKISDGYVFACFIRPTFEKQGIGRALMQETENELSRRGVTRAWLSTGPGEDLRAVGFYTKLGWRRNGFLEDGQIIFEKTIGLTE